MRPQHQAIDQRAVLSVGWQKQRIGVPGARQGLLGCLWQGLAVRGWKVSDPVRRDQLRNVQAQPIQGTLRFTSLEALAGVLMQLRQQVRRQRWQRFRFWWPQAECRSNIGREAVRGGRDEDTRSSGTLVTQDSPQRSQPRQPVRSKDHLPLCQPPLHGRKHCWILDQDDATGPGLVQAHRQERMIDQDHFYSSENIARSSDADRLCRELMLVLAPCHAHETNDVLRRIREPCRKMNRFRTRASLSGQTEADQGGRRDLIQPKRNPGSRVGDSLPAQMFGNCGREDSLGIGSHLGLCGSAHGRTRQTDSQLVRATHASVPPEP